MIIVLYGAYNCIDFGQRRYNHITDTSLERFRKLIRKMWYDGKVSTSFFQGGIAYQVERTAKERV